jgi:NADPH:quinone reductase-like Zn-dependent oxidoreductase
VVESTGIGVTLFKPGDEVFGMLPYLRTAGSHAEYVTGPARAFARKPPEVDHVQAGAIPLAALTAWQALVAEAESTGARAEVLLAEADHAGMAAIAELVREGTLRAEIAAVFPLAEAAKAHERGETGHTTGKLVLQAR